MEEEYGLIMGKYIKELEDKKKEKIKNCADSFLPLLKKEIKKIFETEEYKEIGVNGNHYKVVSISIEEDKENSNLFNDLNNYFFHKQNEKDIKIWNCNVSYRGLMVNFLLILHGPSLKKIMKKKRMCCNMIPISLSLLIF